MTLLFPSNYEYMGLKQYIAQKIIPDRNQLKSF